MVTTRVHWDSLPADARNAVESHAGPILKVNPVSEGLNSEIAVVIHTTDGATFVKGLRTAHPWVWTQQREKEINPYIRHVSTALRWSVEAGEWNLLGFEHIQGRHVNFAPGSPDLPKFVDALRQLQSTPCPDLQMKCAEQRWASYTPISDLFAGDALLHTEWSPGNVMITSTRALFVDWAWPTRGADWIDPGCWVIWLVASGHTAHQAEDWAAQIPSWSAAPCDVLTEFARVQASLWRGIAQADPEPWITCMADAARSWTEHRGV